MSVLPALSEMLTPTVLLVIAVALALCVYLFHTSPEIDALYRIPSPARYPIVGSLLSMPSARHMIPAFRRWCEYSAEGIIHFTIFGEHFLFLYTAEAAEPIFTTQKSLDKPRNFDTLRPWLGDSLLMTSGKKWHSRRKLLTPAFHFGILEQFLEVMNEHSARLVERLAAAGSEPLNVWPIISSTTLDIICETAMGVSVDGQSKDTASYKAAISEISETTNERNFRPWLRSDFLFSLTSWKRRQDKALKVLHAFTRSVIDQRRRILAEGDLAAEESSGTGKKRRHAFLDTLLLSGVEGGETLTDSDIAEETDTFMFAGHDTTASGICWALYNFARFPEVQRKIHEELDEVLGNTAQEPSREDLGKLKYLDRTIKESIRLFTPAAFVSRAISENTTILGHPIPKGVEVSVFQYMIHRDPRHWEDPDRFDPDRFLPEKAAGRHPYSYVPFSAGPRNCIGQRFAQLEMRAVLVAILRHFRLSTSQEYSEQMLNVNPTLQTHGPLEVQFEPR